MSTRKAVNRFFGRYEAPWEIFMIVLAVAFVAIGFIPDWVQLSPSELSTLAAVDLAITIFFVLEFAIRFSAAPSRKEYLKDHWLDLMAVVPLVRWVRIARVVRVIRVMRLMRLARIIDSLDDLGVNFARFARLNGLQWMLLTLTAVMLGSSILLFFRRSPVQ